MGLLVYIPRSEGSEKMISEIREPAGAAAGARRLISVVVPALNEAQNVPHLLKRIAHFGFDFPDYEFELVLVDDGSADGTADLVLQLAAPDDRVTVVRLARSFGSHYAISAGLTQAAGDCAVVLGADLQEPPSLLADFIAHWENGSDVVWGVRQSRSGRSPLHEFVSKSFSAVFSRYANLANYPPEGPSGVLLDRCVIDEVAAPRAQPQCPGPGRLAGLHADPR